MRPRTVHRTMTPMVPANNDNVTVLVVGAGPAGLAAAIELTRHDIPIVLIERRRVLSSHPRATALSLRSMELVRAWGLEADVRARSVNVESRMLETETLAAAAAGTALTVGLPSPEQSRMISPTAPACVAQDDLEPLLLERLRAAPRARVELGTELTGVVAGPDGVRAELRNVRTGALVTVQARYVVAADGARSAVRRALGIPLMGPENIMEGFTTLFRAPLWDVVGERRHLLYSVTHPEAPGTFLPAGPSDRWLFGLRGSDADTPDERRAARLIRMGAGVPDLPVHVARSRHFSAAAQLAERWRIGRVFLAGDAAHRVTPRGGTGLNLALHDGYDLGWKLGWVLRGWAAPALLESYEAERRPVAEYNVARSADPRGSIRPAEHEVRADLGGRIAHVWAGERSTLDLLAPGLTLFAARGEPAWEPAAAALATRVPVAVRLLDPVAARAVGAPAGSALLVRSDGTPVGMLPAGADPGLSLLTAVAAVAAVAASSRPFTDHRAWTTMSPPAEHDRSDADMVPA
jgi:putative polyketide hydroxylase